MFTLLLVITMVVSYWVSMHHGSFHRANLFFSTNAYSGFLSLFSPVIDVDCWKVHAVLKAKGGPSKARSYSTLYYNANTSLQDVLMFVSKTNALLI